MQLVVTDCGVVLHKQAMFRTVESHESVVQMLASRLQQMAPSFQQSMSGDQLMNKYRLLQDHAKVMLKIHCIICMVSCCSILSL